MGFAGDKGRFRNRDFGSHSDVVQHADHTNPHLGGRGRGIVSTGSEEGFTADPNLTRTESSVPLTNSLAAAGDGVDPGKSESGFGQYANPDPIGSYGSLGEDANPILGPSVVRPIITLSSITIGPSIEAPARPGSPCDANPNAAMDDERNQLMLNARQLALNVTQLLKRNIVNFGHSLAQHLRPIISIGLVAAVLTIWSPCTIGFHMGLASAGYNPAFANHQQRLASIDNTQRSFDPKQQPPCHAFYTSEPSKPSSPSIALLTLDGVNRIHQQYAVRLLEQLENVHGMWANASATLPRQEISENRTFLVGETVSVVGIPEAGGKVKVHQWHTTQRFKLVEPELIPQPLTPLSLATYLAHDDAMSAKKELDADEEAHRKWIDAVHNAENKNEQRTRCHSLCQTGTLSVCALPLWETTKETARRELRTFEGLESTVQQVVRATERSLESAIKHFKQVSTTKEHCLKWFNLENSTTPTIEQLLLSLKSAQRKVRYLSSELKKAGHSASEIEQLREDISHSDRTHVAVRKVSSVAGRTSAVALWFYIERIGDDYWYTSSTAWQEYKRRPAPPLPLVECEPDSCSCSWWEWMLWRCSRVHNACRRRCEKEKQAYNAQLAKRNEWSGCDDAHPVEVANSLRMSRCLEEHRDAPELQSAAREEVYERKARMIADQGTREMTLRHA